MKKCEKLWQPHTKVWQYVKVKKCAKLIFFYQIWDIRNVYSHYVLTVSHIFIHFSTCSKRIRIMGYTLTHFLTKFSHLYTEFPCHVY